MSMVEYDMKKILKFIWRCERIHPFFGTMGIGYGLTKRQAIMNSIK